MWKSRAQEAFVTKGKIKHNNKKSDSKTQEKNDRKKNKEI